MCASSAVSPCRALILFQPDGGSVGRTAGPTRRTGGRRKKAPASLRVTATIGRAVDQPSRVGRQPGRQAGRQATQSEPETVYSAICFFHLFCGEETSAGKESEKFSRDSQAVDHGLHRAKRRGSAYRSRPSTMLDLRTSSEDSVREHFSFQ